MANADIMAKTLCVIPTIDTSTQPGSQVKMPVITNVAPLTA